MCVPNLDSPEGAAYHAAWCRSNPGKETMREGGAVVAAPRPKGWPKPGARKGKGKRTEGRGCVGKSCSDGNGGESRVAIGGDVGSSGAWSPCLTRCGGGGKSACVGAAIRIAVAVRPGGAKLCGFLVLLLLMEMGLVMMIMVMIMTMMKRVVLNLSV